MISLELYEWMHLLAKFCCDNLLVHSIVCCNLVSHSVDAGFMLWVKYGFSAEERSKGFVLVVPLSSHWV